MNKAKMNYWIDVGTGFAGAISALSGLVFLLPGDLTTGILGISYQTWNAVHTWSSLAAIAGVGAHLALHWRWMVAMTKQMLSTASRQGAKQPASGLAYDGTEGGSLSRRAFLTFGGAATAVVFAAIAGYRAILDASPGKEGESSNQLATAQQEDGVACPFGVVNDPYPGRCRHYRDSNGDGMCDYSVPGTGSNLSTSDDGTFDGGLSRQRAGSGRP
jgi:hypothetical protein